MIHQKEIQATSGLLMLFVFIVMLVAGAFVIRGAPIVAAPIVLVGVVGLCGLFTVHPNQGRVLQLFGDYKGTVTNPGLRWANPFYTKRKISLRTRNFETGRLKVNDNRGNPVEIGAVVVWRVVDTAEAIFNVDDFKDYVHVQSEAACAISPPATPTTPTRTARRRCRATRPRSRASCAPRSRTGSRRPASM